MEVIASEFPDIYQWFETTNRPPQVAVEVEMRSAVNMNRFSATIPQPSQAGSQAAQVHASTLLLPQMPSSLTGPDSQPSVPLTSSQPHPAEVISKGASSDSYLSIDGGLLSINETLDVLHDIDRNDLQPHLWLEACKTENLCQWSEFHPSCCHGDMCKFVRLMLDLDSLPKPKLQKIMVIKQTSGGIVKLLETVTNEELQMIQQLPPREQLIYIKKIQDLRRAEEMERTSLDKPLEVLLDNFSNFCELLTPSPSPPSVTSPNPQPSINPPSYTTINPTSTMLTSKSSAMITGKLETKTTGLEGNVCTDCNAMFKEPKQLIKHRRNHHQIYVCKECGEKATGYYKMASHSKKVHSKDPAFFCECGRNFGEKKGMTKHQNSCVIINKQQN